MIRLAMLNADSPVQNLLGSTPTYGQVFHRKLRDAAAKVSPGVEVRSEDFDVVNLEYPASLDNFDAIVISGSAASAYEHIPWILQLNRYLQDVYKNHPRVKLFGSCFGHQMVAESLLRPRGMGRVEKNTRGWELGVHKIRLNEQFLKHFSSKISFLSQRPLTPDPDSDNISKSDQGSLRLQFVHGDHVALSTEQALPPRWMVVGSTKLCEVQGLYEPGRVLTFQGHFEFDRVINSETLKAFGGSGQLWTPEQHEEALIAVNADDDSEEAATMIIKVLTGQDVAFETGMKPNGQITPPVESASSRYPF